MWFVKPFVFRMPRKPVVSGHRKLHKINSNFLVLRNENSKKDYYYILKDVVFISDITITIIQILKIY